MKRYSFDYDGCLEEDSEGDFVRYEDIAHLIEDEADKRPVAAAPLVSKHTPGPWKAAGANFSIADTGDYDGCWEITSVGTSKRIVQIWGDDDEDECNAHLMAAAPQMLEALEDLAALVAVVNTGAQPDVGQHNWYDLRSHLLMQARAAIAAAEGRTP